MRENLPKDVRIEIVAGSRTLAAEVQATLAADGITGNVFAHDHTFTDFTMNRAGAGLFSKRP
jgi:hypothetical protein